MLRLALAFSATVALCFGAGCSQPCDPDHVCALDGYGLVCDGKDYRTCDASDRGLTVACKDAPRAAVCTADGWTFQTAPH